MELPARKKGEAEKPAGINRRDFIAGAGALAASTTLSRSAEAQRGMLDYLPIAEGRFNLAPGTAPLFISPNAATVLQRLERGITVTDPSRSRSETQIKFKFEVPQTPQAFQDTPAEISFEWSDENLRRAGWGSVSLAIFKNARIPGGPNYLPTTFDDDKKYEKTLLVERNGSLYYCKLPRGAMFDDSMEITRVHVTAEELNKMRTDPRGGIQNLMQYQNVDKVADRTEYETVLRSPQLQTLMR